MAMLTNGGGLGQTTAADPRVLSERARLSMRRNQELQVLRNQYLQAVEQSRQVFQQQVAALVEKYEGQLG